jgi:hypothetical protein
MQASVCDSSWLLACRVEAYTFRALKHRNYEYAPTFLPTLCSLSFVQPLTSVFSVHFPACHLLLLLSVSWRALLPHAGKIFTYTRVRTYTWGNDAGNLRRDIRIRGIPQSRIKWLVPLAKIRRSFCAEFCTICRTMCGMDTRHGKYRQIVKIVYGNLIQSYFLFIFCSDYFRLTKTRRMILVPFVPSTNLINDKLYLV